MKPVLPPQPIKSISTPSNWAIFCASIQINYQHWLPGDQFTLADIAWMPNLHRMMVMEWPLDRYKNLSRWFDQIKTRSSYQNALVAWEPEGLRDRFTNYVTKRKKETGIHVTAFGALVETQ